MILAKIFILDVWMGSESASAIYTTVSIRLFELAICLLKFAQHIQHNPSNIVHSRIHVTLCSTYLMNDKNYNTCFLIICFYRPCLVCVIYFCRFTDFELQRNKVQSRTFSLAAMESFDTEFFASWGKEEKTQCGEDHWNSQSDFTRYISL